MNCQSGRYKGRSNPARFCDREATRRQTTPSGRTRVLCDEHAEAAKQTPGGRESCWTPVCASCPACLGHGTQDSEDGRERVCGGCGGGG